MSDQLQVVCERLQLHINHESIDDVIHQLYREGTWVVLCWPQCLLDTCWKEQKTDVR